MHRNREFCDIQSSTITDICKTPMKSTSPLVQGCTISVRVFHLVIGPAGISSLLVHHQGDRLWHLYWQTYSDNVPVQQDQVEEHDSMEQEYPELLEEEEEA